MGIENELENDEDTRSSRASQRRMALLNLLSARALSYSQIIQEQEKQGVLDYDEHEKPEIARNRIRETFRRDLQRLKKLGYHIKCDRSTKLYKLQNLPFDLHFTDNQLTAFGLLLDIFRDKKLLHADLVHELLQHLTNLLPSEQQKLLKKQRPSFVVNLKETTDYRNTDPATLEAIERAIRLGQQLEITYVPGRDTKERRHVVEPRPLEYENGHVYLKAYSLTWQQEFPFRLEYIVAGSARVLHDTIAPARPISNDYLLQYWLSPVIARRGVSQRFEGQQVEMHADGSATITAPLKKSELFNAKQILLRYGENCEVHSPPELIAQFRVVAEKFYLMYCRPEQ